MHAAWSRSSQYSYTSNKHGILSVRLLHAELLESEKSAASGPSSVLAIAAKQTKRRSTQASFGTLANDGLHFFFSTSRSYIAYTHKNRYIRVKRRHQTFCFLCDKGDTVGSLKEKVAAAAQQHKGDAHPAAALRLLLTSTTSTAAAATADNPSSSSVGAAGTVVLEDDAETLGNCPGLKHDGSDLLHVVVRVADNEWESVDVLSTDLEDAAGVAAAPPPRQQHLESNREYATVR